MRCSLVEARGALVWLLRRRWGVTAVREARGGRRVVPSAQAQRLQRAVLGAERREMLGLPCPAKQGMSVM